MLIRLSIWLALVWCSITTVVHASDHRNEVANPFSGIKCYSFEVSALAFSPDGKILATGGNHQYIKLWNVATGRRLRILPNGKKLTTLSGYKSTSGVRLHGLPLEEETQALAFSPDGRTLASGDFQHCIKLWDVDSGKQLKILCGHKDVIDSLTFSPDGKTLASGSSDRSAKLWNVIGGKELRTFAGYDTWVEAVGFSADGKTLVTMNEPFPKSMISTKSSADGKNIVITDRRVPLDYTDLIKLWDISNGRSMPAPAGPMRILGAGFSQGGQTCTYQANSEEKNASANGITLWDVATGNNLRTLKLQDFNGQAGWACTISHDGKFLASSGTDRTVRLWDLSNGRNLRTLIRSKPGQETMQFYSVVFSPNGQIVAAGGDDGCITLWDAATGHELRTFGEIEENEPNQ